MASDGSDQRQLTFESDASATLPAWSPDGTTIAFVRRYFLFGPSGLYAITPNGSGQRRISAVVPPVPAVWSADGQELAIATWPADPDSPLAQDVTVIPSAGGATLVFRSSPGPDYPTSWK
jgi:hypothetical protein